MTAMKRQSPVQFDARPVKTVSREDWDVVAAYADEGQGPWLVDLSHNPRWDLQDSRLDDLQPAGMAVPRVPGACRREAQILVNRMNRTQAAVWHLGTGPAGSRPPESGTTDVSEATAFLALCGPRVFAVAEHLTALDLMDPGRQPPFLLQGPFSHVPCQIVALAREDDGSGGLLITCSRGYARDMVQAIQGAGAAHGLRPAGEDRFAAWLAALGN